MTEGLEPLARSFLDLWHHVDGAAARRADAEGPALVLRPFDRDAFRQHAAACRSIEGAVLDLEVDSLDDEIDRTILLASIRPRIREWEGDHPGKRQPTYFSGRLLAAVAERPGESDALTPIPAWVETAESILVSPPLFAVQVALDDIGLVRRELERPEWWRADKDRLAEAAAAIDRLEGFFRHEVTPDPAPAAASLGEDAVGWYLHHAALIEANAQEAGRRLRRRAEGAVATDVELGGAAEAYRRAIRHPASLLRRQLTQPAWLAGFALFAAEVSDPASRGVLARWSGRGLVDLSYHLGLVAGQVGSNGDLPGVVRRPLEALATAMIAIEWETIRGRFGGETEAFLASVVEQGLFHPSLAAWRLGIGS